MKTFLFNIKDVARSPVNISDITKRSILNVCWVLDTNLDIQGSTSIHAIFTWNRFLKESSIWASVPEKYCIWNKIEKSSKIRQGKKCLISTFACFLTIITKFNFWKGEWALG